MSTGRLAGIFLLSFVLAAAGCAGHGPMPPPAPAMTGRSAYVIGPGDQLAIRVWKNDDLSVNVPVRPDGRISVPLADDVQAAGLTPDELKQVLTKALSEYITAPAVTVVVTQINSKRAFVVGEVARPMTVPLTQDVRVLDAISMAGGFTPYADKSDIRVIRKTAQGVVEYHFNYKAYVAGKAPNSNLVLEPGDTVAVRD